MGDLSFVFDTIKTLFVFVFVLVLMLITLRGLAKYQNKLSGNKNIKILERASLSQNTTLNIVKVGERLYLMSSSTKGVVILKELSLDEIDENVYKVVNMEDIKIPFVFKKREEYLKGFKGKVKDEKESS
ncbi:flagellar biosynthetic protein FliO [Clostridium cylindrosporum]|uniref:Flagellar biosynthesis protein FliO n=1 Tax=Clostridium cylindrosporum DSM 605 TaxID=1121307 RepID=A0A0J8D6K0_CLOCY|nr:flagellar biosynthetic protein FliO [Clostridium cylindrosporum]KMT21710.1 flagellar biosynthesis protein FliO [Clostridium cylindrosporum DSM 605]